MYRFYTYYKYIIIIVIFYLFSLKLYKSDLVKTRERFSSSVMINMNGR